VHALNFLDNEVEKLNKDPGYEAATADQAVRKSIKSATSNGEDLMESSEGTLSGEKGLLLIPCCCFLSEPSAAHSRYQLYSIQLPSQERVSRFAAVGG
jgi:hypothetical protein